MTGGRRGDGLTCSSLASRLAAIADAAITTVEANISVILRLSSFRKSPLDGCLFRFLLSAGGLC